MADDGPSTPLLDDFNGPNENPVAGWATGINGGQGLQAATTQLHALYNRATGSAYRVPVQTGDVEAHVTIAAAPQNGNGLVLFVNLQEVGTPTWDGYGFRLYKAIGGYQWNLYKYTNGTGTSLGGGWDGVPVTGDRMLLRRVGTSLQAWHYTSGAWNLRVSATDASYSVGHLGLQIIDGGYGGVPVLDDFGGTESVSEVEPPALPATPILDHFNRPPEEPLSQSGNWASTDPSGSGTDTLEVEGVLGRNMDLGGTVRSYRTTEYEGYVEVYYTVAGMPGNGRWLELFLSLNDAGTGGWDGYRLILLDVSTDQFIIQRIDNGVAVHLAGPVLRNVAPGDRILGRRLGPVIEFWHDTGGAGTWTKVVEFTDETYLGGKIGAGMYNRYGAIENFGGGNASGESLLQLYAPELVYDTQEPYRADSAAEITDNDPPEPGSNVLEDGDGVSLASAEPFPGLEQLSLDFLGADYANGQPAAESHKIDEVDSYEADFQALHALTAYRDQVYGRVFSYQDTGEMALQYWFFYYYNPKTYFLRGVHEGDWEMVQILLDSAGAPGEVTYGQHRNGEVCNWSFVSTSSSEHPRVFVGLESHASYFSPLLVENQHGDTTDGAGESLVPRVIDVTSLPNWTFWPGRWGGTPDEFLGSGSPVGPAFKGQQWDDPRAWGRSSDVDACTVTGFQARRVRVGQTWTRALSRPAPPRVIAYRTGNRVVSEYRTAATRAQAKKWTLITTVDSSGNKYTPLTRRTRLTRPRGRVVQPLGLGKAPFKLHASVIDHTGARSRIVTVPVRFRR